MAPLQLAAAPTSRHSPLHQLHPPDAMHSPQDAMVAHCTGAGHSVAAKARESRQDSIKSDVGAHCRVSKQKEHPVAPVQAVQLLYVSAKKAASEEENAEHVI